MGNDDGKVFIVGRRGGGEEDFDLNGTYLSCCLSSNVGNNTTSCRLFFSSSSSSSMKAANDNSQV